MRTIEEQVIYARLRRVKLKFHDWLQSSQIGYPNDIFISYHTYMKLVKFSVTIFNIRVTDRATHCHAASIPPTASDHPTYTAKLHFNRAKLHFIQNCFKIAFGKIALIAYEQLQIAFYLNTLYILIALKNEVAHLPALFYFQKIKNNNRIKCVCIRASTFFKWFGKLFHTIRYFPLDSP